ncbi:MAG: FAD-dependent oxidoreductase [Gemmatimonadetes bacterium]|nr:FAD-dependent oxidoreductase [Gemmatimonadota bacterium]
MSRVIIIGGGVIGLSCAYYLARRGERVTILEQGEPGGACSAGNLGWIVPSLSEPLPAPGLTWTSLKWMLRRDSPLYVDPRFALSFPSWLWTFWRHCNLRDYRRGLEAVAGLNRRTFEVYQALRSDGVRFEMHRDGLLFVFLSPATLEHGWADFEAVAALGLSAPRRLDRAAVLALEPRLGPDVAGGVLVAEEGHVRPETLNAGLLRRVSELGGEVRSGVEVLRVSRRAGRVTALETSVGAFAGDAFVLAAGAWSRAIGRRFGLALPVAPGKGYSVTITQPAAPPKLPLYLYEKRVGITPFDGAVRLGGTMELAGMDTRVLPERIAAIRRAASRYLPGSEEGVTKTEWAGLRPLTPDGLPLIGRAPGWDNLYVATGHAMLGVTLAPVTGLAIAELVTTGISSADLAPFAPGRFGTSLTWRLFG